MFMKRFVLASIVALTIPSRLVAQTLDAGVDDPSKNARWFATFSDRFGARRDRQGRRIAKF